jgi:hypothetical protein
MTFQEWADIAYNGNLTEVVRSILDRGQSEFDVVSKVRPKMNNTGFSDEFQSVQGIAKPEENYDLQPLPQRSPVKGYKTVVRQKSYRGQLTIEETAWRTGKHDEIFDNLEDLVDSGVSLKSLTMVNFINNGTTAGLSTNIVEGDGTARALFATDHQYEDGSGTFSNLLGTALPPTPDVVYRVVNEFLGRIKDNVGAFISWPQEFVIWTPTATPAYGLAADEVVMSLDRPDTSNRATNVVRQSMRLTHRKLNYLTSTTKWYLAIPTSHRAYPLLMVSLIDQEITPLEKLGPQNPHAMVQTLRTQFGGGFRGSYRGLVAVGT